MKTQLTVKQRLPHFTLKKTVQSVLTTSLLFCATIQAQVSYFTVTSNKASIHGTSTLHEWDSQITELSGKGSFQSKNNVITLIKGLELKIPVKSIKSKEGHVMDNKTYEAFDSEKNPVITFVFANTPVKTDASKNISIVATGSLTMAGNTRPVTLTARGKVLPNGDLQITVVQKIKMTDFKMVPPKAVLGTIHVGDEITVSADVTLAKITTVTSR